jgi:hypothetical protein
MRATHYRHWLPLSDAQVWEVMVPPEFTADEWAIVRKHGRVALARLLGPALIFFVLLCISTTDNAVRDSTIQLVGAFGDVVSSAVSAYLVTPIDAVVSSVARVLAPAYQFSAEVVSVIAIVCVGIWQELKPVFSAISTFVGTWSPQVFKDMRDHVVMVWETPVRNGRQYLREVLIYTLPNHLNCFGKRG